MLNVIVSLLSSPSSFTQSCTLSHVHCTLPLLTTCFCPSLNHYLYGDCSQLFFLSLWHTDWALISHVSSFCSNVNMNLAGVNSSCFALQCLLWNYEKCGLWYSYIANRDPSCWQQLFVRHDSFGTSDMFHNCSLRVCIQSQLLHRTQLSW